MGLFSDALLPAKSGKAIKFSDDLKTSGRKAQARVEKSNVAVRGGASFGALREASTISDPDTRVGVFAKRRGLSEDRYRINGGDIEYQDESGAWIKEEPKESGLKRFAAGVAGGSPETIVTGVGTAAGGPLVGAGLAGASNITRKIYNKIKYNEPQGVIDYTVGPVVDAGVSLVSAGAGKQVTNLTNRLLRAGKGPTGKIIAPEVRQGLIDPKQAGKTASLLRKEGIDPTLTEATGSRTLEGAERHLRDSAGKAGYLMRDQDVKRGRQVSRAIQKKLDKVSDVDSTLSAGEQATGSMKRIEKHILKQARRGDGGKGDKPLVSRLYERAFKEAGDTSIDTKPVLSKIDEVLETASGSTKVQMRKLRRDLLMPTGQKGKFQLKTGMKELDSYYKQTVNNAYKALKKKGDAASGPVGQVRRLLLDEIEKVSPTYKTARTVTRGVFSRLENFKQSMLGKMVYRNEGSPQKIATELFGKNSSPKIVKQAVDMLPEKDMAAMTKAALIDKWNQTAGTDPSAAGAKLAKLVTTDPGFMLKMKAALPKDKYRALNVFFTRVLPNTARLANTDVPKTEGAQIVKERLGGVLAKVALRLNLTPYGVNRNLQDMALGKHAPKIAEQIISGKGVDKILKMRQVGEQGDRYIMALFQLAGIGAVKGAGGARLVRSSERSR